MSLEKNQKIEVDNEFHIIYTIILHIHHSCEFMRTTWTPLMYP